MCYVRFCPAALSDFGISGRISIKVCILLLETDISLSRRICSGFRQGNMQVRIVPQDLDQ